ncbi:MAG: diphthine synthase [Candidatus Altiarchaeota archaeon]
MLYLVGLGLFDELDLSLRGLEKLKDSDKVYLELYTNFYHGDLKKLEKLCDKKIVILKRSDIEEHPDENVLKDAQKKVVSLLVPGDPMVATTHIDLALRARKKGIEVKVIHSSSVYSAVAETGLQIYKFGKTTTLAYPESSYFPTSPYDAIKENRDRGLHTLCLLDVKADEQKYMTVDDGIRILLEIEKKKKQGIFTEETLCVGVSRLGGDTLIKYGKAAELMKIDYGKPPQILVIPGKLHYLEEEALGYYSL